MIIFSLFGQEFLELKTCFVRNLSMDRKRIKHVMDILIRGRCLGRDYSKGETNDEWFETITLELDTTEFDVGNKNHSVEQIIDKNLDATEVINEE